jgi:hypothetical protein
MRTFDTWKQFIREEYGLPADMRMWTLEQRKQYNKALANVILASPENFTGAQVQNAKRVLSNPITPLEDTSFNWDLFFDKTSENASDLATNVGKTITIGLPIGLIVGGLILLYLNKK